MELVAFTLLLWAIAPPPPTHTHTALQLLSQACTINRQTIKGTDMPYLFQQVKCVVKLEHKSITGSIHVRTIYMYVVV